MLSVNRWRPLSEMTNIDYEVDGFIERFFGERGGTETRSWLPPTEATAGNDGWKVRVAPVSYTHLTLPTICSV